jgi:hypothetical protein
VHDAGLYIEGDNNSEQLWCMLLLLRMQKKGGGALSLITGTTSGVLAWRGSQPKGSGHTCIRRSSKQPKSWKLPLPIEAPVETPTSKSRSKGLLSPLA